jgi:general secretion pathway protein D
MRFEMKSKAPARSFVALLLAAFLLCAPLTALAKKGEKNYKRGLQHEAAQQWEKAAQEFALAVAQNPSDTEYQLHYRRAIFNASQMFMQKGRTLAEQGDYVGAYNAFRQAYGYDPVNDLAVQEMNRVLRLQREKEGLPADGGAVKPTAYNRGAQTGVGARAAAPNGATAEDLPGRPEQLQNITYSGELEPFIRKLADELGLNVVFDQNFAQVRRSINVRWKDITAARALDYIFQSQGLFFQKLDRRTILVADQSKRPQYQQLVLRTFYLYNVKPEDARTLIQSTLPANAGRQPLFAVNNNTNSITVRDTPENIRIIEKLLQSVDKDRAEVVMEVAIYEVSRNDLLQIGNQIGNAETLGNLGGVQPGSVLLGGARQLAQGSSVLPLSTGVGLLIPASRISAFQSKNNTRLIFSTQVHAFDDEKSSTRIGAKVPVQTASVFTGVTVNNSGNNQNPAGGVNNGVFGGNGFPVIQYEDTGLVLDFKPKVYPNQDVQVTMKIETKDASGNSLTPIFTQRSIEGVARIPNGKTMMIASVAQDRDEEGRQGLPLLGLIPVLGRLFSTPTRDNRQSDVVITMTPRVLRAPNIQAEDEQTRPAGSMQTPQTESLEAMLKETERDEQLARARALPTNQTVELPVPPVEDYSYVPAPKSLTETAGAGVAAPTNNAAAPTVNASLKSSGETGKPTPAASVMTPPAAEPKVSEPKVSEAARPEPAKSEPAPAAAAKPETAKVAAIPANAAMVAAPTKVASTTPVVNTTPAINPAPAVETKSAAPAPVSAAATTTAAESSAELLLLPEQPSFKVGERRRVMVFLRTDAPVGLAAATLRFDPKALAVHSVSHGLLTADKTAAPTVTQSIDAARGVLVVSVAPAAGAGPLTGEGLLLVVEVEALAAGDVALGFDSDKVHFIATDGRVVRPRFAATQIKVTQ